MTNSELILILQTLAAEATAADAPPTPAPERAAYRVAAILFAAFAVKVGALPLVGPPPDRRDQFAMAVITGLMAGTEAGKTRRVTVAGVEVSYAQAAFLVADAMIAAAVGATGHQVEV